MKLEPLDDKGDSPLEQQYRRNEARDMKYERWGAYACAIFVLLMLAACIATQH